MRRREQIERVDREGRLSTGGTMHCKGLHRESGRANQARAILRTGYALAVFVSLLTVTFLCRPLSAQIDISASLAGTVADQNGGVVPAAIVSAHNVQTGVMSKTTSNET